MAEMADVEGGQRDHDLLSFMSLIFATHLGFDLSLTLLSVHIDDASIDIEVRTEKGGYFSVCLAPSKQLLAARYLDFEDDALPPETRKLPDLVAVKIPRPGGDRVRNRKLWSSMAMELQVLRNEYLRNHPNIVELFGVCWESFSNDTLMPSFILEAAECDLEKFMSGKLQIDERKVLGLSLDIIAGVCALHDVGIIHADIKPENVLIFKHPELTFTAKIADFGSSVLRSDVKSQMQLTFGTGFWQAPEVRKPLNGAQLMQADVFSLGLVLWRLLGGDCMYLTFDSIKDAGITREAYFEELKQSNDSDMIPALTFHSLTLQSRSRTARQYPKGNGDSSSNSPARHDGNDGQYSIEATVKRMAATVCLALAPPGERLPVGGILQEMRLVTRQYLLWHKGKSESDRDMQHDEAWSLNPQEEDAWLRAGLARTTPVSPSMEDLLPGDTAAVHVAERLVQFLDPDEGISREIRRRLTALETLKGPPGGH
jgi:serine/threonine protein kinase